MAIRRLILFAILGAGLLLAILLGLGFRQYSLYAGHKAIAEQTGALLFRYTVIREQLLEAMLRNGGADLDGAAQGLEQFNSAVSVLLGDRRVPDEYKLSFMQAVDLPGMVVLVRQLAATPAAPDPRRNLNRELRVLGERLLLFDRLLVDQAKRRLIGFQNVIIGSLAILLVGALFGIWQGCRRLGPLLEKGPLGGAGEESCESGEAAPLFGGSAAQAGVMQGVVHEVSDLANGMINYAQVLADELESSPPAREIAAQMIATGEELAGIMKKIIFYSRGAGQEDEFLPLAEVLADSVSLGGYAMKNDGIQVAVDLPREFPLLLVNARPLQQVFCAIFDHARRALNLRYPHRDDNKRFAIRAEVREQPQGPCLQLAFSDQGGGLTELAEELARTVGTGSGRLSSAGGGSGLAGLQRLVARQGGRFRIDTVPGQGTTVFLEFPC